MIMNMRHVGIVVKDFEESFQFYTLLGFNICKQKHIREPSDFISKISAGENIQVYTSKLIASDYSVIELLEYEKNMIEEKHTLFGTGIAHIAFTVKNIKKVYEELVAKGIQFNSAPQLSPNGYAIVAFCQAPEGTFIELVEVL